MNQNGWKLLSYNNGEKLVLVKYKSEDLGYLLTICDMVNVWTENLSSTDVKLRCKELNRRLEAPTESILEHIQNSLHHHTANAFSVTENTNTLELQLKNSFQGGIPFVWKFNCEKLETDKSVGCFSGPLLRLVSSLQYSNNELVKIINKKDSEIRDYKESGAKVSRPYLETSEFDMKTYEENLRKSSEYVNRVTKNPLHIASDTSVNDLLSQVETDLKCPALIQEDFSSNASSPKKTAKIMGHHVKRGARNVRRPPRGVEELSDSDNESGGDKKSPAKVLKISQTEDKKKIKKKKNAVDKRKKLF